MSDLAGDTGEVICARHNACKEQGLHVLTPEERALAEHFLSEVYAGHGDERHSSYPPDPVADMVRYDPHYFMCQDAIRDARRLLLAFPGLRLSPASDTTP